MSVNIPTRIEDRLRELAVPPPARETLARFVSLLVDANRHLNLTGLKEPEPIWDELILDSLSALPVLAPDETSRLIDVGSGGGIPGIPLGVARPMFHVELLDATRKKCRFLEEAVQKLGLSGTRIHHARAEALAHESTARERFDYAAVKAVAVLSTSLEWTLPFLKTGGRVLVWKGSGLDAEIDSASRALDKLGAEIEARIPYRTIFSGKERNLLVIRKSASTGPAYPRPGGRAKTDPL